MTSPVTGQQLQYDFCVFHHDDDARTAREIMTFLERSGYKGYIEDRDAAVGVHILDNLEFAIKESRYVLLVLSISACRDNMFHFQQCVSLMDSIEHHPDKVLPVYLPDLDPQSLPVSLRIINGAFYEDDPQADFWRRLTRVFSN